MTVYQYAGNNPVMLNDPLGDLLLPEGSYIPQLAPSLEQSMGDFDRHYSVMSKVFAAMDAANNGNGSAATEPDFSNYWASYAKNNGIDIGLTESVELPEVKVSAKKSWTSIVGIIQEEYRQHWEKVSVGANTGGGLLGYANPASFNLGQVGDAYYTKIVNPNTNYTYLDLWPLTLRHTDVILPNLYVQVRNIGLVQSQRGIAKAWDLARDVVRRDNIEGLIDDPLEANKLFLYQFRTYLKDLFGGVPIVTPSPFKGTIPETTIKYLPIRTY